MYHVSAQGVDERIINVHCYSEYPAPASLVLLNVFLLEQLLHVLPNCQPITVTLTCDCVSVALVVQILIKIY